MPVRTVVYCAIYATFTHFVKIENFELKLKTNLYIVWACFGNGITVLHGTYMQPLLIMSAAKFEIVYLCIGHSHSKIKIQHLKTLVLRYRTVLTRQSYMYN